MRRLLRDCVGPGEPGQGLLTEPSGAAHGSASGDGAWSALLLRHPLILLAFALTACATSPHKTVADLNRRDPEYRTRDCRLARREAAQFDENRNGRMIVAVAANAVVPFAGAAAGVAMAKVKEDRKRDLNAKVRGACVSDPLARRR